ncbi:MAG: hypothetical protein HY216_14220 [Candidatus Rokubacteria bacterium]|nr:hypothetical protein [Candidatus Rokubacteria bacterium]
MPIRKIAKILDATIRDTGVARQTMNDPRFNTEVRKDRRTTLSRFTTVQDALADREKKTAKATSKTAKAKTKKR